MNGDGFSGSMMGESLAAITLRSLFDAGIECTSGEAGALRIAARNSEVGDIMISFDDDEVSVFLGDITHCHFTPYEAYDKFPGCSREQAAADAAAFIREVLADQWVVWRWSDGRAGGCYKLGSGDGEAADGPLPGEAVDCFVWSGRYTPNSTSPGSAPESYMSAALAPTGKLSGVLSMLSEGEVYFGLFGDGFDPASLSIGIAPTRIRRKLEPVPMQSSWIFSSGKRRGEVIDVYEMASSLVAALKPHAERIVEAKRTHNLQAILEVVLTINSHESMSTPAIGFDSDVIAFLHQVGASIDVDTYLSPG